VGNGNAGAFFVDKGGRIGLWFTGTANAVLDDFSGQSTSVVSAADIVEEYDLEFDAESDEDEQATETIFLPLVRR